MLRSAGFSLCFLFSRHSDSRDAISTETCYRNYAMVYIVSVARKHCRKQSSVSQESEFLQNQNKVMETPCIIMGIWRGQGGGEVGWLGLLLVLAALLLTVDLFINFSAFKGLCNATCWLDYFSSACSPIT